MSDRPSFRHLPSHTIIVAALILSCTGVVAADAPDQNEARAPL